MPIARELNPFGQNEEIIALTQLRNCVRIHPACRLV
jgi:hypothetical protein